LTATDAPPGRRLSSLDYGGAAGRRDLAIDDGALGQAGEQVTTLSADVASIESAKDHLFKPRPRAWIADRIAKLNDVLVKRSEKSASRTPAAHRRGDAHAEAARSGPPLLPGEMQIQKSEPARCRGRRSEFVTMVEAPGIEPGSARLPAHPRSRA
jgi:hypothetical protein